MLITCIAMKSPVYMGSEKIKSKTKIIVSLSGAFKCISAMYVTCSRRVARWSPKAVLHHVGCLATDGRCSLQGCG